MKINYDKNLPIPFITVDDFYTEDELKSLWQEIDFLSHKDKLLPPENTSSAFDEKTKKLKKSNLGVFVDDLYFDRNTSNILSITRKIFDKQFMDDIQNLDYIFNFYKRANSDRTLLNYYNDGDYYEPHMDDSWFTAIVWLYKDPKNFTGGDFKFPDHDINLGCNNNQLVIFPSNINHQVEKVKLNSKEPWTGRYSITSLIDYQCQF